MVERSASDDDLDSRPDPRFLLRAMASASLRWKAVLGELIDNSLDASARRIVVTFIAKGVSRVRVQDDGQGCQQLKNFVKLGRHESHGGAGLGRFGIGAKDAILWIGGVDASGHVDTATTIQSTRGGMTRELCCDWQELANRDWWLHPDWLRAYKATAEDRGTFIEVSPCRRTIPTGEDLGKLAAELGYYYSAAIKAGVHIELRVGQKAAVVLLPWQLPELTDVVDTRIDVDGRSARVYAGIVKDPLLVGCKRYGITCTHEFRVIIPHGGLGCGGQPITGIRGLVELDASWHLTKNKDGVANEDELSEAVYAVLKDMLAKAANRTQAIHFSQFDSKVQELLGAVLCGQPDSKGQRPNRGRACGANEPTGRGGKHKRARLEAPGETFARFTKPPTLEFANLEDPELIGESSGSNIVLNLASPFIAQIRGRNVHATVLACALVLANAERSERPGGQRRLRFDSTGDLIRDVSKILAHPVFVDGAPLGVAPDAA